MLVLGWRKLKKGAKVRSSGVVQRVSLSGSARSRSALKIKGGQLEAEDASSYPRHRPPKQVEAGLTLCIADASLLRRWRTMLQLRQLIQLSGLLSFSGCLSPSPLSPRYTLDRLLRSLDPKISQTLQRSNAPNNTDLILPRALQKWRRLVRSLWGVQVNECWRRQDPLLALFAGVGLLRITSSRIKYDGRSSQVHAG